MKKKIVKKEDTSLIVLTFVLIGVGLIMMFSASTPLSIKTVGHPYSFVVDQAIFAIIGIVIMLVISRIDYHFWARFAWLGYGASVIMLILVHFIGVTRNDAKRWLDIGVLQFQPSEIAKIAIILLFATLCVQNQKEIATLKGFLKYILLIGGIAGFTGLQPHLSVTIIIGVTGIAIVFVAGTKLRYLVIMGIASVIGGIGYLFVFPHAMRRIEIWFDPFSDYLNSGWQGSQSFIAIGSGGLFGLGFGQGKQKQLYLSEAHNDFIFSAICEELGFIGGCFVVLLFAVFIFKVFTIALSAKDKFGMLFAVGIGTKIAVQAIINIFVATGIFPVTGASLPFFSYGGTALVLQIAEIGILLNISRQGRGS